MKCLNRYPRNLWECSRCLLVLVGMTLCASQEIEAAPVTFTYDAQVSNVFEGNTGFEFPFEVEVGDTIHGRFSFEPAPVGRMGPQDLGIQFEIAGVTLHSPTYEIVLSRNLFPPIGSDDFEPSDVVMVACTFLNTRPQCDPGSVPSAPWVQWRPFMQLSGDSPILNSYDLIADPNIWNSFTGRSLTLHFSSGLGGGFIDASIGSMTAVPEPVTWQAAVMLTFTIALLRFKDSLGVFGVRRHLVVISGRDTDRYLTNYELDRLLL